MKKNKVKKNMLLGEGQVHIFVHKRRDKEDNGRKYGTINGDIVAIEEKKCTKESTKKENLISSMLEKTKNDEHNV